MRRLIPLAALAALAVGCSTTVPGGGAKVTTPTPETVVGAVPPPPTTTTDAPTGDPAAGKALFVSTGCGACHVFGPAGTTGTIGPDLDKLAEYAKQANQGTLARFTATSITDPAAYIAPGYPAGLMPSTYAQSLKPQQIADLVAFLTQSP